MMRTMTTNLAKSLSSIVILFSILLNACGPVTRIPTLPNLTPKPALTSVPLPTRTQSTPTISPTPNIDTDCRDEGVVGPPLETFYEEGKLARIGRGELYGLDWSSDGSKIAIASETGIYIFDAIRLEKANYINTGHAVKLVRFSPDGNWVAVDDEHQIEVWDIVTGTEVAKFGNDFDYFLPTRANPSTSDLGSISFSPDSKLVAIPVSNFAAGHTAIEIWDIKTQKMIREWRVDNKIFVFPDPVFSPDGNYIASPWLDGVNIWDVESGEVVKKIKDTRGFAFFSNDGQKVVTEIRGEGAVILIVDLQTDTTVRVKLYNSNDDYMPSVGRLSADGKLLVTHHNDRKKSYIDTWDALTGKHQLSLPLPEFVSEMAFNPTRNELATIDEKQNLRVWNLENGALLRTYQFSDYIGSKAYPSQDGSTLVVKSGEHFHLYNAVNGGYVCTLPETLKGEFFVSFNPYEDEFAYITPEGTAIVWNWRNGRVVQTFNPEQLGEQSSSGDSPLVYRKISFGNQEKGFIAWGWKEGENQNITWIGNSCVAFGAPTSCPGTISSDGRYVAVLDQPNDVMTVYDAYSYEVLYRFSDARGSSNYAFSPDGKYILSLRFFDLSIYIWDTSTHEKIAEIDSGMEIGPYIWSQDFSFTTNGDKLITFVPNFYEIQLVRVWNTKTWELENTFYTIGSVGHTMINGDGSLVSSITGYAIYLWHLDK